MIGFVVVLVALFVAGETAQHLTWRWRRRGLSAKAKAAPESTPVGNRPMRIVAVKDYPSDNLDLTVRCSCGTEIDIQYWVDHVTCLHCDNRVPFQPLVMEMAKRRGSLTKT